MMIVIYGAGKFGQATAQCCTTMNIEHCIMDDSTRDDDVLSLAQHIIITPGIAPSHDIYLTYHDKIIGDLDFWYQQLQQRHLPIDCVFIGVTGTDGKSSTCRILYQLLHQISTVAPIGTVRIGGNFDKPLGDIINEIIITKQTQQKHIIIIEISSFMAHHIHQTVFDYSIFTNFKKDHLNRHTNMQHYFDAKYNLIAQTKILSVINQDIIGSDYYRAHPQPQCHVSPIHSHHYQSQFSGSHNMQNIDASYQIATHLVHDIDPTFDDHTILQYIEQIPTLHHRIEYIGHTQDGIAIYDDGKSTTAQSLQAAITSFSRVVVIAGGSDKGDDFSILQYDFHKHVAGGIFIGETKDQFSQLCINNSIPYLHATSMQEAVEESVKLARSLHSTVIIFSPGCASFDMFVNREDRVHQFLYHMRNHITGNISSS